MLQKRGIERNIDWATFSIYLALVMLGWTMIYAVDYEPGQPLLELNSTAGKQMIWAIISFATMAAVMIIDWKFWQTFAYPIYIITLVLLVAVALFGTTIKGQTSWFIVAGFSFQPSEFAKFGTCLAMAAYLSSAGTNLKLLPSQAVAVALIIVPVCLIMLQPDLGSALVFLSFFMVLYREGFPSGYYLVGFYASTLLLLGLVSEDPRLIGIILFSLGVIWLSSILFKEAKIYIGIATMIGFTFWWLAYRGYLDAGIGISVMAALFIGLGLFYTWRNTVRLPAILTGAVVLGLGLAYGANYAFNEILKPHQQDRLNVWLQPEECDPRGSLYNMIQSKMAISGGGATGKGFLQGTMTRLDYVPAQSTDFIFTAVAEEQGFIGVIILIGLFLFFLLRILRIAERQRSNFSRVYAYSFAGILFIHIFINIGMTMGLAPVIGIPLPFISRGGSSLLGFTVMLGILLKLDSKRFQI